MLKKEIVKNAIKKIPEERDLQYFIHSLNVD